MALLENFMIKSSKQITLRNGLIPVGETLENIQNNKIIEVDFQRSIDYKIAKDFIRGFDCQFIEQAMSEAKIPDWLELADLLSKKTTMMDAKEKADWNKSVKNIQATLSEKIYELFKNVKSVNGVPIEFKKVFKKELTDVYLPKILLKDDDKAIMRHFNKFSTYFKGINKNREIIYSKSNIKGSVAYRLINDNFRLFFNNIKIFQNLKRFCPRVLSDVEQELRKHNILFFNEQVKDLKDYFVIESYNYFLTQDGIKRYNQIVGGISMSDNVKVRGLNEFINLECQQNDSLKDKLKNLHSNKLNQLYKQILSDRDDCFYIDAFSSDKEVIDSINKYYETISDEISEVNFHFSHLESRDYYFDKIYIGYKNINFLSKELYGGKNWGFIRNKIIDDKFKKNADEQKIEKNLSKQEFSIKYLNDILGVDENSKTFLNLLSSFLDKKIDDLLSVIKNFRNDLTSDLKSNDEKERIKKLLDNTLELYRLINLFASESLDRDDALYQNYSKLGEIVRLYNKVRNYLTKKPYSLDKFKLNFDSYQLAVGWSESKINDYLSFLLLKDGKYYLAIIKKGKKLNISNFVCSEFFSNAYKKVNYMLFKCSQQIPKALNMKAVKSHFANLTNKSNLTVKTKSYDLPLIITREIYDIYVKGLYTQDNKSEISPEKRREYLRKWIDFCKDFLSAYGTTRKFDFSALKPSDKYKCVDEFYHDLDCITYKISYEYIDEKIIHDWVEKGNLYLFQIYNKDFSDKSTGVKNLHSIYLSGVFEPNSVIKLDGNAELFYRKKSIDINASAVVHRKGSFVLNRVTSDLRTIPENIYRSLLHKINDKNFNEFMLTEEEMNYYGTLVKKKIDHDIIKDKRFTCDKFFFHCPITINYKSVENRFINNDVNEFLCSDKNAREINIIGIDRGERNLLYVTVINQNGKILYNKSFNTIVQQSKQNPKFNYEVNYHDKLKTRERERDLARKSWDTIGKIATLKEGYLSAVIHEIAKLIIEYNAIVVMENLNFNFKRIRGGIAERSVYQKFEKMLIDKLYNLVLKERHPMEPFGVFNGRQLASKIDSFEDIGDQVGFIFYVTAAYTSKIDPTSGFSNLFKFGLLKNAGDYKNFFKKFDSISYDADKKLFKYSFDYKNFEYVSAKPDKTAWEVYTYGTRIIKDKDRKDVDYDPTKKIIELLEQYSVDYKSSQNILVDLLNDDGKKYNESFWIKIFLNFKYTVQMRNSKTGDVVTDYLISPVINSKGYFFCTQSADSSLPNNADSNGAFHIALKGLMVLNRIYAIYDSDTTNMKKNDTKLCSITNNDWFNYVIKRN